MTKLKETPDAGLATPAAIKFRIERIRNDGPLTPAKRNRIEALMLRLPPGEYSEPLPAVNPALLISKGSEEWGDRKR